MRTIGPILGLFVPIWMHFSCWIQIWQWKFEIWQKIWKRVTNLACHLLLTPVWRERERVKIHRKHEERWSYSNLNHSDEAFVLMFTWVITENSLHHLMFLNSLHIRCWVQMAHQVFFFLIQIFIAIFGFIMKNAFKWVQTSLVLVQWFLRQSYRFRQSSVKNQFLTL